MQEPERVHNKLVHKQFGIQVWFLGSSSRHYNIKKFSRLTYLLPIDKIYIRRTFPLCVLSIVFWLFCTEKKLVLDLNIIKSRILNVGQNTMEMSVCYRSSVNTITVVISWQTLIIWFPKYISLFFCFQCVRGGRMKVIHFDVIRNGFLKRLDYTRLFARWRVDAPWQACTKRVYFLYL